MRRLAFAAVLIPLAFATGAEAQTVGDAAVKTLWCGEAFSVLFSLQGANTDPNVQPIYDAYTAAAAKLVANGTQAYLDGGYTEEQVTKIKSDLVTEVTSVVGSQNQAGKFSPDDCNAALHAVLVLPPSADASSGASAAMSAPASDMPASSAAQ